MANSIGRKPTAEQEIDAALGGAPLDNSLTPAESNKKSALERYLSGLKRTTLDPAAALFEESSAMTRKNPFITPPMAALFSMGKGIAQGQAGQERLLNKSIGGFTKDPSLAGAAELPGRMLAARTPMLGPIAGQTAETISKGDFAGAAGEFTGILATMAIPLGRGSAVEAGLPRALPKRITHILKPSKGIRVQMEKSLPAALNDEAFVAASSAKPIESVGDLMSVTNKARSSVGKQIESTIKNAGADISIDGNRLADRALAGIPESEKILNAPAVEGIKDGLNKNLRRPLALEEAERLRQGLNAELGVFFRRNKISQREAKQQPAIAHKLALRDALGEEIDAALAKGGADISSLRKRYSALRSLEDAANERMVAEMTKDIPGFFAFDSIDTITAGSAVASIMLGRPEFAVALLTTVGARRVINIFRNKWLSPDHRIKSAFGGYGKAAKGKRLVSPATAAAAYLAGQEESPEEEK